MPLRIAFDLDGVLADMDAALVRQAEILFGDALSHPSEEDDAPASSADEAEVEPAQDDAPSLARLDITPRQQRKLWERVESIENFWETLDEIEPGAVARLAALAAERRWEVIFLTKRPPSAGATAQRQTQRWLESKGFPLPSVFVVLGSRGRIAASLALDYVIDDRIENCLDVAVDSEARAILIWRDRARQPASARRLGIGVTPSVAVCLDVLAQIDRADRQDAGVMAKLMRLLGLKAPATA